MGLSPANCRKVMMACIQSVAMFRSELWWKADPTRGTIGQANEPQLLVNQEVRRQQAALGQQTWALSQWSRGSGRRQRSWRTGSGGSGYDCSACHRDQAREVVGAPTAIGRRLVNALAYAGKMESTVLLEEPRRSTLSCCWRKRKKPGRRRRRLGRNSPCLRTGYGSTTGPPAMRWCARKASPGWA